MKYRQFQQESLTALYEQHVMDIAHYKGETLVETASGWHTPFGQVVSSLDEAQELFDLEVQRQEEDRSQRMSLAEEKAALLLPEHYPDTRVDTRMIRQVVQLAKSQEFTVDPVVQELQETLYPSKFDKRSFELRDGSKVMVSEETFQTLNKVLREHPDVVDYMNDSLRNFVEIVDQLEE